MTRRFSARRHQRGFLLSPYRFGSASGPDPNFASVVLLLHMDGADGSTTFIDSSSSAKSATVGGNAQIDTAQSKFGGASGLFDGSGDYLSYPSGADFGFGTGDYTVEGWARFTGAAIDRCVFDNRTGGNTGIGIYVDQSLANANNRLTLAGNSGTLAGVSSTQFAASAAFQHWAVSKSGTTVRGFIDGLQVWSITDSRALQSTSSGFIAANYLGTQSFLGHLDDIRVTKGVARYVAGFSPPSAPFPNF